jgi:hypothetical protein
VCFGAIANPTRSSAFSDSSKDLNFFHRRHFQQKSFFVRPLPSPPSFANELLSYFVVIFRLMTSLAMDGHFKNQIFWTKKVEKSQQG